MYLQAMTVACVCCTEMWFPTWFLLHFRIALIGPSSYSGAARVGIQQPDDAFHGAAAVAAHVELCPYAIQGQCRFVETCPYVHGDVCDLCFKAVLVPGDQQQNEEHKKVCCAFVFSTLYNHYCFQQQKAHNCRTSHSILKHFSNACRMYNYRHVMFLQLCMDAIEQDAELAFAIAESKDKQCGICMDTVLDKQPAYERKFGILSDCNHVFCLSCIRKWRSEKQYNNKVVK